MRSSFTVIGRLLEVTVRIAGARRSTCATACSDSLENPVVSTRGKTEHGDVSFMMGCSQSTRQTEIDPKGNGSPKAGLSLPRYDDNVSKFVTHRYAWASFGQLSVNTVPSGAAESLTEIKLRKIKGR
jgi:hypothetical protein